MSWFSKKEPFGSNPTSKPLSPLSVNTVRIKNYSYNPNDRIGKGYSSIVYKGINQHTNETIAIKCIDMKGIKDSISREMLDCEIEALKTLKHQNILHCIDVVRETTHCYIVTEFCNEGDLSGLLKKKRRFSQNQSMKILKDIVSGFIQIGQKSFLHRDLKLANIFMNNGKAKIADFGFAKKFKHLTERQRYNVGSPLYMSPQALKRNIYSIKNDIWSIGIMIYELLHGQTPWECKTEKQLMDKMIKVPVKFKQSLNISEQMKYFIKKCLEVQQSKRMSLADLKQWYEDPSARLSLGQKKQRQRVTMPPKLDLGRHHSAIDDINGKPLAQLTNRLTARTHRNNSFTTSNANAKQNRQNRDKKQSKDSQQNGQGKIVNQNAQNKLSKAVIEKNNAIVVNEINIYRLLYKILERLKRYQPEQSELMFAIQYQVIKRVTNLKNCCVDESQKACCLYPLKQMHAYLSESSNPSIKKYKSVMTEYFKKYTTQIKSAISPLKRESLSQMLSCYLKSRANPSNSQQILMVYWMTEFIGLPIGPDLKKQYLDGVIDPKIKLTREYVSQRIKQVA